MAVDLRENDLDYHRSPYRRKPAIQAAMAIPQNLLQAYLLGVAAVCEEIKHDPPKTAQCTTPGIAKISVFSVVDAKTDP